MKRDNTTILIGMMLFSIACSKSDNSSNAAPATPEPSSGTPVAPPSAAGSRPGANAVRGRLVSVSDTALTVESQSGETRIAISQPLEVYSRVPAKLSDVKPNSFVGVTSVPQSDGTLRATEIHIFPEKLRGTNEGSFLMGQRGGGGGSGGGAPQGGGNTMTNGTVAGTRGSGNRMTNGTVGAQSGTSILVRFQSDSQTIVIPPDVRVTAIALTKTKLIPGKNVVIQTTRSPDGALKASTVMLSPARVGSR
jgi:hypothetical protein